MLRVMVSLQMILCLACFGFKDQLLDNEKGTQSLAFSGGGYSKVSGTSSLFSNPAGMRISMGSQIQAGVLNIAHGFSPFGIYGRHVSEMTSYALGFFRDGSDDKDSLHQGIIGGYSLSPGSFLSLGIMIFTQSIGDDYGIEMNCGVHYRWQDWIHWGFAVKNIFGSYVGSFDNSQEGRQNYILSASFLPHKRVTGYYDMKLKKKSFKNFSHIFSLAAKIGPQNIFTLINSCRLEMENKLETFIGTGIKFNFRNKEHVYDINYSVGGFTPGKSNSTIVQSFAFSFHLSPFTDKNAPIVSVKEELGILVPSSSSDSHNTSL